MTAATTTAPTGAITFTNGATAMTASTAAQAGHKAPTTAPTAFQATTGASAPQAPQTAREHWQVALRHLKIFFTILGLHLRMAFDRWQRRLWDGLRPHMEVITDQAAAAWRRLPSPARQAAVEAWPSLQAALTALTMAIALTVWEVATFTAAVTAAAIRRQWQAATPVARRQWWWMQQSVQSVTALTWIRLTSE